MIFSVSGKFASGIPNLMGMGTEVIVMCVTPSEERGPCSAFIGASSASVACDKVSWLSLFPTVQDRCLPAPQTRSRVDPPTFAF